MYSQTYGTGLISAGEHIEHIVGVWKNGSVNKMNI